MLQRLRFLVLAAAVLAVSVGPFEVTAAGAKAKLTRADLDGDGVPNVRDRDIDGDRKPNGNDRDTDGDRKPNGSDRDVDGDRKPNSRDRDIDSDRKANGRDRDVDADGKPNSRDRDIDSDGVPNLRDRDMDGDGVPNGRDRDTDGDGLLNLKDPDRDGDGVTDSVDKDLDSDGIPDYKDFDVDGDGVPNARDVDSDGDGIANAADRDMDGDGVANDEDHDTDGDGEINYLDADIDNDGLPNHSDSDSDSSGDNVTRLPEQVDVRVPASFFGLVAEEVFASMVDSDAAKRLDIIARTGVRSLRQRFDWAEIEVAPGVYDFKLYDPFVAAVARADFELLPVLFNPPAFHSSRPTGSALRGTFPPRDNASFARFAQAVIGRYGPNGSLWRERPDLPRRPLRTWQVWNEPNLVAYWQPHPDAAAYAAMLRTVAAAIRAADPGAEIVSAALPQSRVGVPIDRFLRELYAAGVRGSFDTLAIHPYASAADGTYDIVEKARSVLDANGDSSVQLWITELGWATGGPKHPHNLGETAQSELIKRVFATLIAQRERFKLRGLVYFNWRDALPYPGGQDDWGLHTGLFRLDGSEKPAYGSFVGTIAALSRG